jgi:hypothetical protein
VYLLAWYIPPDWIKPSDHIPETIFEAAQFTARLAADGSHTIPYSNIPLIIHQTWKDTDVDTWEPDIIEGVEQWLTYAAAAGNASLAYFLWLDEGCRQLVVESEPNIVEYIDALPLKVEKSDVFRVLVLNTIGGVVSCASFCHFSNSPRLSILISSHLSMEILIPNPFARPHPG